MEPNSYPSIEDIPEAQRDHASLGKTSGLRGIQRFLLWFSLGLLSAIAGLVVSWVTYGNAERVAATPIQPMVKVFTVNPDAGAWLEPASPRRSLLGHWAYEEVDRSELVPLAMDASISLRPAAATAFEEMAAAAEAEGVHLVPLSGFRSIEDQQYLFFEVKAERGQTASDRAEVSAPPGYSEHHTGYAIDIGDGNSPGTNLQVAFEETAAYAWLEANAPRYSFELSFPEGNDQGVQYEPWHWRFVGDSSSLETFYQNR